MPSHSFRPALLALAAFAPCSAAFAQATAVTTPATERDLPRFEVVSRARIGACRATVLKLTSQVWRGREWWHWLSILVPPRVDRDDGAVLFIAGGSNRNPKPPETTSRQAALMAQLATQSRCVLAVLQQVPNQPLYDGLYEDDLIAYTFDRFLETGDREWPLLRPMVQSARAAMDAVTEFLAKSEPPREVRRFVVTGASKRGWTTWLTGAADPRVVGIAPMVIDMLDLRKQLAHQRAAFGRFSEQIAPYTERRIPERMDSERGEELADLVDPIRHLAHLDEPKLVLLGTNDPYWTVDASSIYFARLPGTKHMFQLANAGHGLGLGVVPTLVAFLRATLAGRTLPELNWRVERGDRLRVSWKEPGKARVWRAHSKTRDFRKAEWKAEPLEGERTCVVELAPPRAGWEAAFVEVRFRDQDGRRFGLTTEVFVRPAKLPFAADGTRAESGK